MPWEGRIAKALFSQELATEITLCDSKPLSLVRVVNTFVIRSTSVTRCLLDLLVISKCFD